MFSNEPVYFNMNNGYVSNIYDSFINALNELKEKIYSNVENIINGKPSLDELIENLKASFNASEDILSHLDFFKDEYYDFSSIKDMIFYILDNKTLLNNISMFKDLINSFYNLVLSKRTFPTRNMT